MIGGIEETSASFEARYAPRSYPTPISRRKFSSVILLGALVCEVDMDLMQYIEVFLADPSAGLSIRRQAAIDNGVLRAT
jgi:hypothetical protein